MSEHVLLKSQKNLLFSALEVNNFDPATFKWEKANSNNQQRLIVPRLVHVPSDGFFQFDLLSGVEWCMYSPGENRVVDQCYPGSWDGQVTQFNYWLHYLRQEYECTDMWSAISGASALVLDMKTGVNEDNSMLSQPERKRLSQSLNEIHAYLVSTNSVSVASNKIIEERLNYLEQAAERVGRKDWMNLAYGTLINIVVGAALPPNAAKDFFRLAGSALAWIIGDMPHILLPING